MVFVPTPVNKPATFNGHNLIPRVLSYPSLRSEKAERGRQEKEPGNEVVLAQADHPLLVGAVVD